MCGCVYVSVRVRALCFRVQPYRYGRNTPEGRRAGKPLAGGYYAVLWGVLGDLDYFHAILELPHFARAANFCPLCQATKAGATTWCNFRQDAPWRATCWQSHTWRSWPQRCALFDLSYTSCLTVCLDYMHVKYLGCDQYMFGAVLELLTTAIMGGAPEENLRAVWAALKDAYKQLHTPPQARYRYLNKLSMFTRKGYAKLRGKAGEIRHLGRALRVVFEKFYNPAIEVHREILLMLRFNNAMERILEENRFEYSLPPAAAQEFRQACDGMLLLQAKIARHFAESGCQLFDLTTKCHLLQHLGLLGGAISPRVTWCFSGEDFMQKSQCLAQACARGTPGHLVMPKMAGKYRVALQLQFTNR